MFYNNADDWINEVQEKNTDITSNVFLLFENQPADILRSIERSSHRIENCEKIIIKTSCEAPHSSVWFEISRMLQQRGFNKNSIMIIDMGAPLPENIIEWTQFNHPFLTGRLPESQSQAKDKIFVSLARIPKPYRVLFTVELLRKNLVHQNTSIVSCGVANEVFDNDWKQIIPPEYRDLFPIAPFGLLDKPTASSTLNYKEFSSALINVIQETGFNEGYFFDITDKLKPTKRLNTDAWDRITFTEKSFKCFILKQVPLFLSSPGSVEYVRSLGFDVFDDFVDHSYDTVVDPFVRIQMVATELERLYKILINSDTTDYSRMIENFDERSNKNFLTSVELSDKFTRLEQEAIRKFLLGHSI